MLLHPWDLYNHDFTPKAWTPEIVSVLKHSMKLNPRQPGAHHYYIHAVEASAKPVDALAGATITGNGVTAMIKKDLMLYVPYLKTLKN